jgi:hypothetical protein
MDITGWPGNASPAFTSLTFVQPHFRSVSGQSNRIMEAIAGVRSKASSAKVSVAAVRRKQVIAVCPVHLREGSAIRREVSGRVG